MTWFRLLRLTQNTKAISNTTTIKPPIVPPTIVPTGTVRGAAELGKAVDESVELAGSDVDGLVELSYTGDV